MNIWILFLKLIYIRILIFIIFCTVIFVSFISLPLIFSITFNVFSYLLKDNLTKIHFIIYILYVPLYEKYLSRWKLTIYSFSFFLLNELAFFNIWISLYTSFLLCFLFILNRLLQTLMNKRKTYACVLFNLAYSTCFL